MRASGHPEAVPLTQGNHVFGVVVAVQQADKLAHTENGVVVGNYEPFPKIWILFVFMFVCSILTRFGVQELIPTLVGVDPTTKIPLFFN